MVFFHHKIDSRMVELFKFWSQNIQDQEMMSHIAKLIFNFKLEDVIPLFSISPTTHQISGDTSQIRSGTSNLTKKVYWQCSTTTFAIDIVGRIWI